MDLGKAPIGFELQLQGVPRIERATFTKNFVQEQQRYSKVYTAQGKAYFDNWLDNVDAQAQVSGGDDALDIGVGTLILKARNPKLVDKTIARAKELTHQAVAQSNTPEGPHASPSSTSCPTPKAKPAAGSQRTKEKDAELVPNPKKQRKHRNNKKESKRRRSDVDEEHEERLRGRRERRKARRDIVKPKESDSPSSCDEEGPKAGKQAGKKKPKVPAGLALMHGFHASNVGKSRLTMERSHGPSGLFMKGKASAKTPAAAKSTKRRGFSEQTFLDNFFGNKKGKGRKDDERDSSSDTSDASSSSTTPSALPPPKKKCKHLPKKKDKVKELDTDISAEEEKEHQPRRQAPSSITWDIEKDSVALPSTVPSLPVAKPKPSDPTTGTGSAIGRSPSTDIQPVDSLNGRASEASITPSDSVSRCEVDLTKGDANHGKKVDVVSRFFETSRPALEGDDAGELRQASGDDSPLHPHQGADMLEEPSCAGPQIAQAYHRPSEGPLGDQARSMHQGVHFTGDHDSLLDQPSGLELEEPHWEHHASDDSMNDMAIENQQEIFAAPSFVCFALSDDDGFLGSPADVVGPADPDSYSSSLAFDYEELVDLDMGIDAGFDDPFCQHNEQLDSLVSFQPGTGPNTFCYDQFSDPVDCDSFLHSNHHMVWECPPDEGELQFRHADDLQEELLQRVHSEEPDYISSTLEHHEGAVGVYEANGQTPYISGNEEDSNGSVLGCSSAGSDGADNELLSHFLQGRSLLLHGSDTRFGGGEHEGGSSRLQRVEIDVGRTLKDHWRPQKL